MGLRCRLHLAAVIALVALGTAGAANAAGNGLLARQITQENVAELSPGGIDAIGGVGDWLVSNGTLCAVVSAPDHQAYLSLYGGTLVDLWHCDRANDQWVTLHEQRNLAKTGIPRPGEVSGIVDSAAASLQVRGEMDGLETLTTYRLSLDAPTRLEVALELRRTGPGEALNMLGMIMLHPRAALVPYTLNPRSPEHSIGASQPYIDTRDFTDVLANVAPSSLRVLAGVPTLAPPISYGVQVRSARLRGADGQDREVQSFVIGSNTFTNMGLFTEPFVLPAPDTPGALSFLRGQLMDVEAGQTLLVDLVITVGDRADAASVTDQLYRGVAHTGRVDAGPAGITVTGLQGQVFTFVRSAADGQFSFRLPAGEEAFRLEVQTPWGASVHTYSAPVPPDLGMLATGAYGTLHLPQLGPVSLVFKGEQGTPDPVFSDTLTGVSTAGERLFTAAESHRVNHAGIAQDVRSVRLAPGHYRVLASRGMEYTATSAQVEVRAGESVVLDIAAPARAVATPDLVAADLHLHSGISMDSNITPAQRVVDFVAQGGEVLGATEHNITYDIAGVVKELGLAGQVVSVSGVELTGMARSEAAPNTIGHSNVFPVPAQPSRFRGGTLDFEGMRLGQVIGAYKARYPGSVFQLNHPRANVYDDDLSFFNHLSQGEAFDPALPLSQAPNASLLQALPGTVYRDIDFDAMELLNGDELAEYLMNREDWFALLRQGHFKVATANSDSHVGAQLVAIPRTYLGLEHDDLAGLSPEDIASALLSGHVYGTTGPVLRVRMGDSVPGQVYSGAGGELEVRIDAAPWVGVDKLRVFVDGELTLELPAAAGQTARVPLEFERDSFVTVEVSGPLTPLYTDIAPGLRPLAFSNPVFIDVDDNGYRRE